MNRKSLGLASVLVVASLLAVAVAVGARIPDGIELPIHWGLNGEPDGFAGKWAALLIPAGMAAALSILFWFMPMLEPRREGLERSQGLYLWGWLALLGMAGVAQLAVVSVALGWDLPVNRLITGAVGAMLVLIGNQLGKSRSMYMIGFRTPWTLASEEVWVKTHRLSGKLMVAGGLVAILASLLSLPPAALAGVMLAVILVSAGVPFVYSFLLWRREAGRSQASE